jgi:hypothetical protein
MKTKLERSRDLDIQFAMGMLERWPPSKTDPHYVETCVRRTKDPSELWPVRSDARVFFVVRRIGKECGRVSHLELEEREAVEIAMHYDLVVSAQVEGDRWVNVEVVKARCSSEEYYELLRSRGWEDFVMEVERRRGSKRRATGARS